MTWDRFLRRLRAELRLTGLAAWRGLVELVNSNDLTHAAAIAYYSLLSLFPFLLLVISILDSVASATEPDRQAVISFVFRYFPTQAGDFVSNQLGSAQVRGSVAGKTLLLGNGSLMADAGIDVAALDASAGSLREAGASVMFLAADGRAVGILAVADPVKAGTPAALMGSRHKSAFWCSVA